MITVKEFPNVQFKDKDSLFKTLVENKRELIDIKKSALKKGDPLSYIVEGNKNSVLKSISTSHIDNLDSGILKRTIIGNTYYWKDSHRDVHVKDTFKKSISDRKGRVRFYHDHIHQVNAKVGRFIDVYQKEVLWSDLNVSKSGYTTVLMADAEIIKAYNPSVFQQYVDNEIDQHSVGMFYVDIKMAINSDDYPEEKKEFLLHIDKIGNKEDVLEDGFYWAVYEAKLDEISSVPDGSNELTFTLENKEAVGDTSEKEPSADTRILEALENLKTKTLLK